MRYPDFAHAQSDVRTYTITIDIRGKHYAIMHHARPVADGGEKDLRDAALCDKMRSAPIDRIFSYNYGVSGNANKLFSTTSEMLGIVGRA